MSGRTIRGLFKNDRRTKEHLYDLKTDEQIEPENVTQETEEWKEHEIKETIRNLKNNKGKNTEIIIILINPKSSTKVENCKAVYMSHKHNVVTIKEGSPYWK